MAIATSIWVFWRQEFSGRVVTSGCQLVAIEIGNPTLAQKLYASFVYGKFTRSERISLWDDLRLFASSLTLPWLIRGDFNIVTKACEKLGGNRIHSGALGIFWILVADCGLIDAGFDGSRFTRNNNR